VSRLTFSLTASLTQVLLGLAIPVGCHHLTTVRGSDLQKPTRWEKAYMLDVDYLATASAALRAGACFTALLYTEHHCEQQYGRWLTPHSPP
jgi:hypothetical protein